jgi:L-rhamnose mutarotase
MKKNNLPFLKDNSYVSKIEWDDLTRYPKDYNYYRKYVGQKISILEHNEIAFAKNPDGSVDFSKKINFDDLILDLKNIGIKLSDRDFVRLLNCESIDRIESLSIFYNQLKNTPWDGVDRINDLVSAANLEGEYDTNFYLIKKWLCTTYAFALRDIDSSTPDTVYSRVVFILCSEKRGIGKTVFFRRLGMSGEIAKTIGVLGAEIYAESPGEIPKDDRNFAIDRSTKILYLFDDINELVIKQEGTLRSYISQDIFTHRALYKDSNQSLKRTATFAGTTNYSNLLKNNSENRYMMFTVKDIMDFDRLNGIKYIQLWAQIREEIIAEKEKVFFNSEDLEMIRKMSDDYIYISPLEQVLNNMFVYDENGKIGFSEVMKSLKEEYSISASMNNVGAKLKLLAPEGVDIIHKKNGKRYYKLQWRNLVDEGEGDDQDLPF